MSTNKQHTHSHTLSHSLTLSLVPVLHIHTHTHAHTHTRGARNTIPMSNPMEMCVFMTVVPITKLFARGGGGGGLEDMCYERLR
jgi:hypothetical protein